MTVKVGDMSDIPEQNGLFYPNPIKNVRDVPNNALFDTLFWQNESNLQ